MADVVWERQALDDLDHAILYIEQHDPAAAEKIGDALFALGQSLSHFPKRGRPRDDGTRELATVPPFILRYRVKDEHVTVLDIRHGRQRPR